MTPLPKREIQRYLAQSPESSRRIFEVALLSTISKYSMGLSYHFSFRAPASATPEELEEFLQTVEGDAQLMGFNPTTVLNGPFDTLERRALARRVARGLLVEDDRLRGVDFEPDVAWNHGQGTGYCRLAPNFGVLLVVTDEQRRETVFGFFRYPQVIRNAAGQIIMPVPGDGSWISGDAIKTPDPRYRAIVRRFAGAGYLASELDEFTSADAK